MQERLKQVTDAKNKSTSQIDNLFVSDKHYDKKYEDMEKKTFIKSFLDEVNIYEEEQEDGRILKNHKFRFLVFFNDQELHELDWDNESTVETVVLLSKAN